MRPNTSADELKRQARALAQLDEEVVSCRRCARLVAWREAVAEAPRASFANETYWARPLPGFGDRRARLLLIGLAPAAHGGNRTGRMFTGDRSGDFLYAALHRAGYASIPTSTARSDGLELDDAYITAAVRCAPPDNRPTPLERDACAPYLGRELELLSEVRVVLALGAFALEALWRQGAIVGPGGERGSRPRFVHGGEYRLLPGKDGRERSVLCSYHPSQRNVFTKLLTEQMIDDVLGRARLLTESLSST